jgi:hypothetical protein
MTRVRGVGAAESFLKESGGTNRWIYVPTALALSSLMLISGAIFRPM